MVTASKNYSRKIDVSNPELALHCQAPHCPDVINLGQCATSPARAQLHSTGELDAAARDAAGA